MTPMLSKQELSKLFHPNLTREPLSNQEQERQLNSLLNKARQALAQEDSPQTRFQTLQCLQQSKTLDPQFSLILEHYIQTHHQQQGLTPHFKEWTTRYNELHESIQSHQSVILNLYKRLHIQPSPHVLNALYHHLGSMPSLKSNTKDNDYLQKVYPLLPTTSHINSLHGNLHFMPILNANLQHVNLTTSDLQKALIQHTNLAYSNLERIPLNKSTISHTNLQHAKLQHASLHKSNISHINLQHANLSYAHLFHSNLHQLKTLQTSFRYSNLSRAQFHHLQDHHSYFDNASLLYAQFHNSNLHHSSFNNARLQDSQFHHCHLQSISFHNSQLQHAQFHQCTLVKCDFTTTNLKHANLQSSKLINCKFNGTTVNQTTQFPPNFQTQQHNLFHHQS